jgi:hypothetical protein
MPDFDIDVIIAPRAEDDGSVEWRTVITDSDKDVKLSAEDI